MNHNISYTKHADIRGQQRGINKEIVEHLIAVGKKSHCGAGSLRYNFTPNSRKQLKKQLLPKEYAHIESKLNSFAIVSSDGLVITVGRQTKRFKR